jgi:hypothetical protein
MNFLINTALDKHFNLEGVMNF